MTDLTDCVIFATPNVYKYARLPKERERGQETRKKKKKMRIMSRRSMVKETVSGTTLSDDDSSVCSKSNVNLIDQKSS